MSIFEKTKELLLQRQYAYKRTFNRDTDPVRAVLQDLAKFCRAEESCFHQDPRIHAVLEGRREVYLRILKHIELNAKEFLERYNMEDKE